MVINFAIKEDASDIRLFCQSVWVQTYALDGLLKSFTEFLDEQFSIDKLHREIEQQQILLARTPENGIAAIAIFNKASKEVETFYVLSHFQNQGLGKRMMQALIGQGMPDMWLTCWEHNTKAIVFYERLGFKPVSETFFELNEQHHRNIIFELSSENHLAQLHK